MSREQAAATPRAGVRKRVFAWCMARGGDAHDQLVEGRKRELLGGLRGEVLEIGPGAGVNLRYYAPEPEVHWIGVEPNPYMVRYLKDEAAHLGRTVEVRQGSAEAIPAADESLDAVVSTLVLCSVSDLARTLREVRRVLRPGGRFVFIEHVAAPERTFAHRVQRGISPLWQFMADGCHPDRDIARAIESAGFREAHIERFSVPAPIVAPHIAGYAVK